MRKAVCVAVSLMLVLACCGCAGGVGGEAKTPEVEAKEIKVQKINRTCDDFDYFTLVHIPEGYNGFYDESATLHPLIGMVGYEVLLYKASDSARPVLHFTFTCDLNIIKTNTGLSNKHGEYLRDSANGCWEINQDRDSSRPQLFLYPKGEGSVGVVKIFVTMSDKSEVPEGEYYDELVQDAITLADGLSESSFTIDDYKERLYG